MAAVTFVPASEVNFTWICDNGTFVNVASAVTLSGPPAVVDRLAHELWLSTLLATVFVDVSLA